MLSPPRVTRFEGDNGPYRLSAASRNAAERCFPELFPISVVNDAFLSLSPPKVESLHDFLKRASWKRDYGFPVSTKIVLSRFTLFVHATVWLSLSARYWFWRVVIFIVSKIFIVLFFFFSGSLLRISKQSDILIATKKKYIHTYIYIKFYHVVLLHTLLWYFDLSLAFSKNKKTKKKK